MRISGNSNMNMASTPKVTMDNATSSSITVEQGSVTKDVATQSVEQNDSFNNSEETKIKLQKAVSTLNDFLETTENSVKLMYHEGLNRYYVTVVDRETEEIVRDIPPKNLLDAFYEMQKLLGIIVDEKI